MARRTGPAPGPDGQPGDPGRRQEEPEGYLLGVPYDWRKPSNARSRARSWNPDDRRMFPPKAVGWGYSVNFYWVMHPVRYVTRNS